MSKLKNMSQTTNVTIVFNQTFSNVSAGFNRVLFDKKLLFSPSLSNIYYISSENLQIGYSFSSSASAAPSLTNSSSQSYNGDLVLIEKSFTFKRIDSISEIKFYFNALVEQFIYEKTLNPINFYAASGFYNVSFSFWGNYTQKQIFYVYVLPGKKKKDFHV
jgi:hypothetical protein